MAKIEMGGPNKIKAAMQYGVAKPNLFVVNLFGPQINGLESSFGIEGIRCVTAEIPATTVTTSEHSTYGVLRKYPSGVDNNGGQTTLSFMVDNSWEDISLIQLWQEMVYSPLTGDSEKAPIFNFKKDYIGRIEVMTLTRNGEITYKTELEECFPTSIQTIALDSTNVDTPLLVTVDFSFTYQKKTPMNVAVRDSKYEEIYNEMVSKQRTRDDIINARRMSEESALERFKRLLSGASSFSDRAADVLGKINRLEGQINRGTSTIDRINNLVNPDG